MQSESQNTRCSLVEDDDDDESPKKRNKVKNLFFGGFFWALVELYYIGFYLRIFFSIWDYILETSPEIITL